MPPAKSKTRSLKDAEKALLKRWIDGRGRISAALGVRRAAAAGPARRQARQPGYATRSIVSCWPACEKEGLHPSPEADRYTLARRVTIDLTGLPPTIEMADRFVNDKSPDAYEKLSIGSSHRRAYGERWAHVWLDLARYADSNGYATDGRRTHLEISRLGDRRHQQEPAVRPLHHRADRRRHAAEARPPSKFSRPAFHRNTLTNDEGGTERRGVPRRRRGRSRQHDDAGLDGHDDGVRPVPRSQVRSDQPGRIFSPIRDLQSDRGFRQERQQPEPDRHGRRSNNGKRAGKQDRGPEKSFLAANPKFDEAQAKWELDKKAD